MLLYYRGFRLQRFSVKVYNIRIDETESRALQVVRRSRLLNHREILGDSGLDELLLVLLLSRLQLLSFSAQIDNHSCPDSGRAAMMILSTSISMSGGLERRVRAASYTA